MAQVLISFDEVSRRDSAVYGVQFPVDGGKVDNHLNSCYL